MTAFDVVVPTTGRQSLLRLLAALERSGPNGPPRTIVVDDRGKGAPLSLPAGTEVLIGPGRGPAAARNVGWRAASAKWVAFLDDDVVPAADWATALAADLDGLEPDVAGSQGTVVVPLPGGRRPTDWERNVAGLQDARWATADLCYRRSALAAVGGFDERFPRAYREDSDLGLRVTARGWRIALGRRQVHHPPGTVDRLVSLRRQAGNADDALMRALHGKDWRARAGAPRGRLRAHAATAIAATATLACAAAGRRRAACALGAAWVAGTAELAWRRIAPGPRTVGEVATMLVTSAGLPFAAVAHRAAGTVRARLAVARGAPRSERPAAVLLDRDGTLVHDVPYNGDPELVTAMPGARAALARLRAAGIPLAVISNQSAIAAGRLTRAQVDAVNARVDELLGPIGTWVICPHGPQDGCQCRKPRDGMIREAADRLGVSPARCAVIGDVGTDVEAAHTAGARAILVPTERTRLEEIAAAPERARDLTHAVELLGL
ncbi:MAG: hypothetical protein QOH62_2996 [Solirubrobacteraceae bacterium]|jgi:HAD superfamily hydrolase (TIGR01662 family)|nr:hypothetical protein [Solirubrobacteraceae bacterium]